MLQTRFFMWKCLQVASLLKEKFQGKEEQGNKETGKYIDTINDIFNFKLKLYQEICPSDSMTLPQKEMVLFALKVSSFVNLFLLYVIAHFISIVATKFGRKVMDKSPIHESNIDENKIYESNFDENKIDESSIDESKIDESNIDESKINRNEICKSNIDESKATVQLIITINTTSENDHLQHSFNGRQLLFTSRLKLTFIKFLKLYFTPVTVACLKLTHCVNINDERRLYVYADQTCYTYCQIFIFAVLIPGKRTWSIFHSSIMPA